MILYSTMNQRKEDERIESVVASYLDKYFYPRFDPKFTRVVNKEMQSNGVDVIACGKYIDEKVKIRRNLNKVLNGISFEIARRPWPFKKHTVGWFTSAQIITNNYLFISVFSSQNREEALCENNIDHVVCLSVRKDEVYNYLQQTSKDLVNKSVELGKTAMKLLKEGEEPDWVNKPRVNINDRCYIVFSWQIKKELPFNLVIPREILKQLPGTVEYYCGSTGVKKLP